MAEDWLTKMAKGKPSASPKDGLLSFMLHRHLVEKRPGRSLEVIHASDVTDPEWCAREVALRLHLNMAPEPELISTARKVVFKQGEMLATAVVQWCVQLGIAVGDWECIQCHHPHVFQGKPDVCFKCDSKRFFYREIRVRSEVSGISSGIDLLVRLPGETLYRIVELKTIDKEVFKTLAMPLAEHRLRTNLYLRCFEESRHLGRDLVNTQQGLLLYISKGGFGKKFDVRKEWGIQDQAWTPFQQFTIDRDDEETAGEVGRATVLWEHRTKGGPWPDGICATAFCERAKWCKVKAPCFSGSFKAGTKPKEAKACA